MLCHPYTFLVTLTYDDEHLPSYRYDWEDSIVSNRQNDDTGRFQPILCDELRQVLGSNTKEFEYVERRLDHPLGLPHGSVEDLQKFFKRLNRYLNYHVTKSYKNFLYWFVCELGPTTFRPHYHGLIFFESKEFADRFSEILAHCWTFGNIDCSPVISQSASANYVAQYLNCFANLPQVYKKFREFKPFFLCSRKTIIGSDVPLDEDLQEIFFAASPRRSIPEWRSHRYLDVPLLPSIENRLFPKIARFSGVSDIDRITLYGLYERANCKDFGEFQIWCKHYVSKAYPRTWEKNVIYRYIMSITYDGQFNNRKAINSLYRYYCIIRRCAKNAASFGVSLSFYASRILEYWNRKEYYNLTEFYRFQSDYVQQHSLPDLIHCYPEFYYQWKNGGDIPHLGYVLDSFCCDWFPDFDSTFDIRTQVEIQRNIRLENTKTHAKNAYLDSQKMRDAGLKNIIKWYKNE